MIGDPGVGKSSLIDRYIRNEFPSRQLSNSSNKQSVVFSTVIDGKDVKIIFIEISTIAEITNLVISVATPTACILMFSITDHRSFTKLNRLQEAIKTTFTDLARSMPLIVVANKIDLESERAVSDESIDKIRAHGFTLFETSVKGNVGVDDSIYTAVKYLQEEQYEQFRATKTCHCLIS